MIGWLRRRKREPLLSSYVYPPTFRDDPDAYWAWVAVFMEERWRP